jgi:hypothetical protein
LLAWSQTHSEDIAGLVLAMAALATAWSGYQASIWGGIQAAQYNLSTQYRAQASRANDDAARQRLLDIVLFAKWLEGYAEGRPRLTALYEAHFRPEFRSAFAAWRSRPDSDIARLLPFQLPQYHLARTDDAERLDSAANAALRAGDAANGNSDGYVFVTVIFANVLFFAGAIRPLVADRIRGIVLVLAIALCLGGLLRLFTLPVAR